MLACPSPFRLRVVRALALALAVALAPPLPAGDRADALRMVLDGADQIVVVNREISAEPVPEAEFRFVGQTKIAELVAQLDFDEGKSGFHCMCAGDLRITILQGARVLAVLSHHHGRSLRWLDGTWEGDSLFAPAAAKAWRAWFQSQGEPRFEVMEQKRAAEAKAQRIQHDRFLSAFPPGAAAIFEESEEQDIFALDRARARKREQEPLSGPVQKLIALFPNRPAAAVATARGLGSLVRTSVSGERGGSWGTFGFRETLLVEFAHDWTTSEFQAVLQQPDPVVLLGAARLFFAEGLDELVPTAERGAAGARLAEVVFREDRAFGNVGQALRAFRGAQSPVAVALLERVALDEFRIPNPRGKWRQEPSAAAEACIYLAQAKSPRLQECLRETERRAAADEIDLAALAIARSFSGERGQLTAKVFRFESFTIPHYALLALEKENSREALEAIVEGATRHVSPRVREDAVLAVQRMTGQRWTTDAADEKQAERHAEAVRAWWAEQGPAFQPRAVAPKR